MYTSSFPFEILIPLYITVTQTDPVAPPPYSQNVLVYYCSAFTHCFCLCFACICILLIWICTDTIKIRWFLPLWFWNTTKYLHKMSSNVQRNNLTRKHFQISSYNTKQLCLVKKSLLTQDLNLGLLCTNFIPIQEWTWCHCVFYVSRDWNAHVVAGKYACDYKKRNGNILCACRDPLWCHIHSKVGSSLAGCSTN